MKLASTFLAISVLAFSQSTPDPKQRVRTVRDLSRQGDSAVAQIGTNISDPDLSVRLEAVKALNEIGGPKTVTPLVLATQDNDAEMQIRATDGLVNTYLPGYLKTGISGTLSRAGNSVRAKFTDTNDQVVDGFVQVPAEVIAALGRLVSGGASFECRANAARALGILRGRAAIPDLIEALRSKDSPTMYEALIAIQKIGDVSAGPRIAFLLRDLDEKVQVAAIETTGLLRNRDAAADVRSALEHARTPKVKRAAVTTLAFLADPPDRAAFTRYLTDPDDAIRAAAAEGLGRLKDPSDKALLEKMFTGERKMNPRLAAAFALSLLGHYDAGQMSPFRYLINALNLKAYKGVAVPYLTEVALDPKARQAIYPILTVTATKDEKIGLGTVLARSGDHESVPYLETLSRDTDSDVAQESIRNLRALRARLP